jgi:hypothetical protein
LAWRDQYPPGSPTHDANPYAFKAFALEHALKTGHELVVWADSSAWFIRNPGPLFTRIQDRGFWCMYGGWTVGTWCIDKALPLLGVTRDEAFKHDLVVGGFFGLNLKSKIGRDLLAEFARYARNGAMVGPWSIDDGKPDDDPKKVRGHRHDQCVLSIVLHRLGLKADWAPTFFAYHAPDIKPASSVVAVCQGM